MSTTRTENLLGLVEFALAKGLIEQEDRLYSVNRLMEIMRMDAPEEGAVAPQSVPETATQYLDALCAFAAEDGIIEDSGERRDLFSAKLMGALTPSPAEVRAAFSRSYRERGPAAATTQFYEMCRSADYIRVDRVVKNVRFFEDTPAGRLEITINLSKPEKDPKDIAAQRAAKQTGYPKCMLCVENPGYAGRVGFPARQNHRMIPIELDGARWYMQYSPYLYYNEHCIVLNSEHVPMKISRATFVRLCDFVDQFPHYMLGSNADLPIVGGSILSHDHFQGGGYRFPMEDAGVRIALTSPVEGVRAHVADWPMTCIVFRSESREKIIDLSDRVLTAWRGYSDPACEIYAETDAPHNTVTPILRKENGEYVMSLVLRNNRTSEQYPLGIFHPHPELHHVKKENIGLIEVMGLFILPGRLKEELGALADILTGKQPLSAAESETSPVHKHYEWICEIAKETGLHCTAEQADAALKRALGAKCAQVLRDAGVYKQTPEGERGVLRFVETLGFAKQTH
ncbi:MAG: UDP-glucose--hexose-1-phosphate uridylyltransferase [Clostridia bacterium]|nr:UDP-glucose--hexose-1-phosphate uridylyltransferase [Clostridia bacterium]